MNYPCIIGISGNRGVGKDTLYKTLNEVRPIFYRFAFADELKEDLQPLLEEKMGIDVWTENKRLKEIIRPILIAYGCAQREIDPDYWVKKVITQINRFSIGGNSGGIIPVITDVRFENEASLLLKTFGSIFVHVHLENINAPEPTDEEKKHHKQVAAMANFKIIWGNNDTINRRSFAKQLMDFALISLDK